MDFLNLYTAVLLEERVRAFQELITNQPIRFITVEEEEEEEEVSHLA